VHYTQLTTLEGSVSVLPSASTTTRTVAYASVHEHAKSLQTRPPIAGHLLPSTVPTL